VLYFSSKLLFETPLFLVVGMNEFSGPIPKSFAMLLELVFLDLSFNSLEGEDDISALKDLGNLEELHLSRNNLEGNVGAFGDSESLRVVDICTWIP
jgi:hypothetical protein